MEKMKSAGWMLVMIFSLFASGNLYAFQVLDPNYAVEPFVSFPLSCKLLQIRYKPEPAESETTHHQQDVNYLYYLVEYNFQPAFFFHVKVIFVHCQISISNVAHQLCLPYIKIILIFSGV